MLVLMFKFKFSFQLVIYQTHFINLFQISGTFVRK